MDEIAVQKTTGVREVNQRIHMQKPMDTIVQEDLGDGRVE